MASYDESLFNKIADALKTNIRESESAPQLLESVQRLAGHVPVVALFGKTGAGKSSLGNGFFGCDVFKVSDVEPGTREAKPITQAVFGVNMTVIDFPGIGESRNRDDEYRVLYSKWVESLDVILWLVKVDDRALEPDLDFLSNVVKPAGVPEDKIIYVLTQSEKAAPHREWDFDVHMPGKSQARTIAEKVVHVADTFTTKLQNVVAISTEEGFNLPSLANRILEVCPARAVLSVARAMPDEAKTEQTKETVKKRLLEHFKDFLVRNEKELIAIVTTVIGVIFSRRRA